MKLRVLSLLCVCSIAMQILPVDEDTTSISDARIQEKKELIASQARFSRWAWRATEATSVLGMAVCVYIHYFYNLKESNTGNDASHASGDTTQTQVSNMSDQERITDLENQVRHLKKACDVNMSNTSNSNVGYLSLAYLWPKAKSISWSFLKNFVTMQALGVQNIAAKAVAGLCLPAQAYRVAMNPVYLTDFNHFVRYSTRYHDMCRHIRSVAEDNFSQFQRDRDEMLLRFVSEIESILAFLSCAHDYMSESIQDDIARIYDDVYNAANNFLSNAYVDTKTIVTSSITQMQTNIDKCISEYHRCLDRQDVVDWLTSL